MSPEFWPIFLPAELILRALSLLEWRGKTSLAQRESSQAQSHRSWEVFSSYSSSTEFTSTCPLRRSNTEGRFLVLKPNQIITDTSSQRGSLLWEPSPTRELRPIGLLISTSTFRVESSMLSGPGTRARRMRDTSAGRLADPRPSTRPPFSDAGLPSIAKAVACSDRSSLLPVGGRLCTHRSRPPAGLFVPPWMADHDHG